jgi:hypothetical protein
LVALAGRATATDKEDHMPAKDKQQQKVDRAALLKKLTAGFDAKPTKRGGKDGFVLIQHDGRTLAMASVKNTGAVRLEGARLDKNLTIIDAKGVALGRKAIEKVRDENLAKAREAEAKKAKATKQPADGRPKGKSVPTKRVEQAKAATPAGKRARNRQPVRGEVIA